MKKALCRIGIAFSLVFLVTVFICLPGSIQAAEISTDKTTYVHGEKIKVTFSGSSGHRSDWISLSKVGTSDKQAGVYEYIPQGATQGTLIFDSPNLGKYEARGYYDYSRSGYLVHARCSFEVVASPSTGGLNLMERKADPANAMESNLSPEGGLVYIFNWYSLMLADQDVQIRANGKPVVVLANRKYFSYRVPAGKIHFTANSILERNISTGTMEEITARSPGEATIEVKPGCIYFLSLTVVPTPGWDLSLNQVSHEEGDNIIKGGKLSAVK